MAEFSEKYSKIIKDIEKSISDEKEREIVLKKVSELSFMYMDVIDRISNVNSERMDDIEKHQDKLDEKIGKVKDTVDLIKKDIYEKFGVKEYWIVNTVDKSVEVYLNNNNRFYLDNIYVYFTDEEIAENEALANDDKNKLTIYTDIKVSVCDNLVIKVKDIFENI